MFITNEELIEISPFKKELTEMSEKSLAALIERADIFIATNVNHDYSGTESPLLQQMLKTATWRTVDYLLVRSSKESVIAETGAMKSESIGGDYSYTLKDQTYSASGTLITGDRELDSILEYLAVPTRKPAPFSVSGPTRTRKNARKRRGLYGF